MNLHTNIPTPTKFVVVSSSEQGTNVSVPLTKPDAETELSLRKQAPTPPGAWHELMDLPTAAECMLVDPTLVN